jgi:hypothetical protein
MLSPSILGLVYYCPMTKQLSVATYAYFVFHKIRRRKKGEKLKKVF